MRRTGLAAVRAVTAVLVSAGMLVACGTDDTTGQLVVAHGSVGVLHGTEVSDVIHRPSLRLNDTAGAPFDLRVRRAEEITLVFFGYTRCPDLCPTVMADLSSARRQLPAQLRDRVQIVFVSEDPAHDTPAVLRRWLDRFDPSIVGLIGGNRASQAALDTLKTTRTEHRHDGPAADIVEHSGSVYAFAGARVVVYTGGTTPAEYADDLMRLAA